MPEKMKTIYGKSLWAYMTGFFLISYLLLRINHYQAFDSAPILILAYTFLRMTIFVCIPYLKYGQNGFAVWRVISEKKYKWSAIKEILYSPGADEAVFKLSDNTKFVIGMNCSGNYLNVLGDFIFCVRKNNRRLVMPQNILNRIKHKKRNIILQ